MPIDRIGKGGGVPPPATPELEKAERAEKAEKAEKASQPSKPEAIERPFASHLAPAATTPVSPAASSPLEQLRRGEIDLAGYLDAKVDEATRHLRGLRPHELEAIKSALRDELASDPGLADLVQRATGAAPTASTDE